MTGVDGHDHLVAALSPAEAQAQGQGASFGLDLQLATETPAVLHERIGWIDFGMAGSSYYYSRPRMAATGQLTVDGRTFTVDGTAWFDHQWGNFIAVGAGGWDWFAVNLADGTDLTLSLVRDAAGGYPLVYGTLVEPDGSTVALAKSDFSVTSTGSWTSPKTGAHYPAGWHLSVPGHGLEIDLAPTVAGPGARHATDDRGRLLGRVADRARHARRAAVGRGGLRRADRLRPVRQRLALTFGCDAAYSQACDSN